jgi:Uma2 family endonuclease
MGLSLAADETLLVVEVADSSLEYDLAEKASVYAEAGVPEYWVVTEWQLLQAFIGYLDRHLGEHIDMISIRYC